MNVWNEHMQRTKESMKVMSMARKALEKAFEYALSVGLAPDSFCYVVNEAATTISMKHALEIQLGKVPDKASSCANRIEVELSNDYKLVAEQNTDPQYNREIFLGVVDANGVWHQDLAVVRSSYHFDDDDVVWSDDQFDVLVYGNENNEDFTEDFTIGLYREPEQDG